MVTNAIGALRRMCSDGPLSVEPESIRLLTHSIKVALIKPDTKGCYVMVKRGSHNQARDDVAVALTAAAGFWEKEYRCPYEQDQARANARDCP